MSCWVADRWAALTGSRKGDLDLVRGCTEAGNAIPELPERYVIGMLAPDARETSNRPRSREPLFPRARLWDVTLGYFESIHLPAPSRNSYAPCCHAAAGAGAA